MEVVVGVSPILAVAPLGDDDETNFELLVKYLGVTDEKATEQLHKYSDEYVSLSWLRARFSNVSDTDSEEYVMYSARAYLLYLLGCTLFVDKTGTRVQIVYLRLLRNLDSVAGYSWGSGCLAWLYRQLGQASRSKVKQIAGYMTLLEAWVYEHMHGVVVPDHDLDYLEVQPRALRWIPRRDNGTTSVDVQKYRQLNIYT
ncbi:PREDICTED: serine/threonine-protein phosphatase 7 long form homolog [Prunus mume]|uniref:Serine/threonine-protein phosphatase 7 long form homolog n=1 Tax=Prunus mume TaxID=102107 RepID=A0ABM1LLP2_PRUMU|nr:PREDICTED: serine/threonine-protein phosphatase 7 long form homolog [Prunus mume]